MTGWRAASGTATGARHLRRGEPNEDACAHHISDRLAVVAVADGHGSPRCPRARTGAQLAVRVAVETLTVAPSLAVAPELVERWRLAVSEHASAHPDPDIDVEAYGTTLLAAAATEKQVHLFRWGDGVVIGADEERVISIPPSGISSFGETTGLAAPEAETLGETHTLAATEVDLVLLATDGFGDAFVEPDWHGSVVTGIRDQLFLSRGDDLSPTVVDWCRAPASVAGDDTTLALVFRHRDGRR